MGCYGVWDSRKGFLKLTNFCMEPVGFISSKRFILKGNLWDITFISGEKARIFVPEGQQANGQRFKYYFDAQYVDIRLVSLYINSGLMGTHSPPATPPGVSKH